jgi:hypothetical protein
MQHHKLASSAPPMRWDIAVFRRYEIHCGEATTTRGLHPAIYDCYSGIVTARHVDRIPHTDLALRCATQNTHRAMRM